MIVCGLFHRGSTQFLCVIFSFSPSKYRVQQLVVGTVDEGVVQLLQVDAGGAFGGVAHALTDDGDGYMLGIGGAGPGMAADVGGEVDAAEHLAEDFQSAVVEGQLVLVLAVCDLFVLVLRKDGEEVGAGGLPAVDDLLHHRFDAHDDTLVGLATDVADEAAGDVGLTQERQIDEGHAAHAEAEEEEVARQRQLPLGIVEVFAVAAFPLFCVETPDGRRDVDVL